MHVPIVVGGNAIGVHVIGVGIGGESLVGHVVAGRRQVPPSILVVGERSRIGVREDVRRSNTETPWKVCKNPSCF